MHTGTYYEHVRYSHLGILPLDSIAYVIKILESHFCFDNIVIYTLLL